MLLKLKLETIEVELEWEVKCRRDYTGYILNVFTYQIFYQNPSAVFCIHTYDADATELDCRVPSAS